MLASRLPLATGWGFFLSLATFWLLWLTINVPLSVEYVDARQVDFTRTIPDIDPTPKTIVEPPKPKPERLPVIGPLAPVVADEVTPAEGRERPDRIFHAGLGSPSGSVINVSGVDHDAEVLFRVRPLYPPYAIARNIEGWVQVRFSVAANGRVQDVVIVDADPPGVFDDETIEAVRQWRYRPKVEDGRPVERAGLQAVIRFDL